jgi:hypothetical protein
MEIFLLLLQIPILIFLIKYIRKLNSDPLLVNSYYYLLSFKVTAGLILGIIYFSYYKTGDTISYGKDLDFMCKMFYSDFTGYLKLIFIGEVSEEANKNLLFFWDIRAFTFLRMISPFYVLSGSNYWIFSIYLSLFSFCGLWLLSNTLINLYKLKSIVVLISFFVFPSVVFWSSGVIKESLAMGMIGIILSILLNLANRQGNFTIMKFFVLIIFSFALFYVKYYYFAIFFAVIVPYGLIKYSSLRIEKLRTNKLYRISLFIFLIITMTFLASFLHPLLNINKFFQALYLNYNNTLNHSLVSNSFVYDGLTPDPFSFLTNSPKALLFGLFGPFIWQTSKLISGIGGIENTFLIILFIVFLVKFFRDKLIFKIDIEEIALIIYISILAACMAFASPNWGSLVRYKIAYLPFFLLLILNNNPIIVQLERKIPFLNFSEKSHKH